jgi:hypothetical protein
MALYISKASRHVSAMGIPLTAMPIAPTQAAIVMSRFLSSLVICFPPVQRQQE